MDLSHWDLVEEFSLHEASSLAAGVDPGLKELPPADNARRALLRREMYKAYDLAYSDATFECSTARAAWSTGPVLSDPGLLPSKELREVVRRCLARSDSHIDCNVIAIYSYESEDTVRFDRETLAIWFQQRNFKTGYQFLPTQPDPAEGRPAEKPLGAKERETLFKLTIGMAIKGYGYDPSATRNDATTEITRDLEALGITLDSDTVRKWLREAAKILPPSPHKPRS